MPSGDVDATVPGYDASPCQVVGSLPCGPSALCDPNAQYCLSTTTDAAVTTYSCEFFCGNCSLSTSPACGVQCPYLSMTPGCSCSADFPLCPGDAAGCYVDAAPFLVTVTCGKTGGPDAGPDVSTDATTDAASDSGAESDAAADVMVDAPGD